MSIPTHNLYDFVHQATKRRFWLMYFYPWGSRELGALIDYQIDSNFMNSANGIPFENRFNFREFNINLDAENTNIILTKWTQPILYCHDQEPLKFALYDKDSELIKQFQIPIKYDDLSLKVPNAFSIYKKSILLHSELNSNELTKFEDSNLFVGAYWWSHAVIARDWYRFAEHDLSLLEKTKRKKIFLTYCRRIDDTSLYRQKFLDYVSAAELENDCLISSNYITNPTASLSAEYHAVDFLNTAISVVLETTFDSKIHLTEKTLRPIACGHPFIIANGPGCLALLRKYGFKTFHPYINESYDNIVDDNERLSVIVKEMQRLQSLSNNELDLLLDNCKSISDYNKNRFFSSDFLYQVTEELKENVDSALLQCQGQYHVKPWLDAISQRKKLRKNKMPVNKKSNLLVMFKLIKKLRRLISNNDR
jgi:hypothetical protein